jgi:hypothetical protein
MFVFVQKLDERAFLFRIHGCSNGGGLGGISINKIHLLGTSSSLERGIVFVNILLEGGHLCRIHLALHVSQLLGFEDKFGKNGFSYLTLFRFILVAPNGNGVVRSWYVQFVVHVAYPCMELVVSWLAEHHMVATPKGHNFKCDPFFAVIVYVVEGHMKCYATQ